MESVLAGALLELVKAGGLKTLAGVIFAGLLLFGYLGVKALALLQARAKAEGERDKASEVASQAIVKSIDGLTAELRTDREERNRQHRENAQSVTLLTSRVEQVEVRLTQAIAREGAETRAVLEDRRHSEAVAAARETAAVAAALSGLEADGDPPAVEVPIRRTRTGSHPALTR